MLASIFKQLDAVRQFVLKSSLSPSLLNTVWTEESWLQKYANAEENNEETQTTESKNDEDSDEESEAPQQSTRSSSSKGERSRVYLDIQIGGSLAGRVEIEV